MNSDDEVTSSEEDGNRQGRDTDQILEEVHSQEFYHTLANPEIKFVVGSQVNGKPYLLHNGFSYQHRFVRKSPTCAIGGIWEDIYRCREERKGLCKMEVVMRGGLYIQETTGVHNHFANAVKIKKFELYDRAYNILKANPNKQSRQLYYESCVQEDGTTVSDQCIRLVKYESFRSRMGDFRAFLKGHPNGATDPVRLVLETPWDRMVVYDSGPGEDRTIAFSTRAMMEKIARAKVIASDGTFDTAPDGWAQLYVIHFQEGDELLPGMVALMTRKTSEAYRGLLFGLERWIRDNLALEWQPEKFLTDFEVAMDAIILEVFGAGTVHKGCYFHMTQAQQKKLRSLNFGPYYIKDVRFSEWVNKWKVLAVIPSLHIEELVEYLLDRQHPDHQWLAIFPEQAALETFTNYLINTWTGRREDVGRARIVPRFRIDLLNHYDEAHHGDANSTCSLESWNKRSKEHARQNGYNFYDVLDFVQMELGMLEVPVDLAHSDLKIRMKINSQMIPLAHLFVFSSAGSSVPP